MKKLLSVALLASGVLVASEKQGKTPEEIIASSAQLQTDANNQYNKYQAKKTKKEEAKQNADAAAKYVQIAQEKLTAAITALQEATTTTQNEREKSRKSRKKYNNQVTSYNNAVKEYNKKCAFPTISGYSEAEEMALSDSETEEDTDSTSKKDDSLAAQRLSQETKSQSKPNQKMDYAAAAKKGNTNN